jgi:hypothetical protein
MGSHFPQLLSDYNSGDIPLLQERYKCRVCGKSIKLSIREENNGLRIDAGNLTRHATTVSCKNGESCPRICLVMADSLVDRVDEILGIAREKYDTHVNMKFETMFISEDIRGLHSRAVKTQKITSAKDVEKIINSMLFLNSILSDD